MTALTPAGRQHIRPLTVAEGDLLEQCEDAITRHLDGWIEVANALETIKVNKLYRRQYPTFDEYCQGRWNFSASRARQLMAGAESVTTVTLVGLPAPSTERLARELARLPADQRAAVWRLALELNNDEPTAAQVRAAADELAVPDHRADTPGDEDGSAPSDAGAGEYLPPAPAQDPGLADPADSTASSPTPSPESGPRVAGGREGPSGSPAGGSSHDNLVDTPVGPIPKNVADVLDPDPDPHANWRLGYLKRVHAVHAVIRSKPADVAEMADVQCFDELTRCVDALNAYYRDVCNALDAALPDNVTPIRRTS